MRIRLIYIQATQSGSKARRTETFEGTRLSIGRHSGSGVHLQGLSIALNHAKIESVQDRGVLTLEEGDFFSVNGRPLMTSRRLEVGDRIRIGRHELRVVEAAPEEDLALEIEQVEPRGQAAAELAKRTKLGLEGGWWSVRRFSWVGAGLLLLLFFLIPLLQDDSGGSFLMSTWNPGPVTAAHRYFEEDCSRCHVKAFRRVPDLACLDCHTDVGAHSSRSSQEIGLDDRRCGSCHLEHNETRTLSEVGDPICLDCHSDLGSVYPSTELLDAGDFSQRHPGFRPSSLIVGPKGERRRPAPGSDAPGRRSGLAFGHRSHLEPIRDASDQVVTLQCGDCHQQSPQGTTMEPTDFERDCRRCHLLLFDSKDEEQQAPHSEISVVRESLYRYFSALALRGRSLDSQTGTTRRRPGREIAEAERLDLLAWVRKRSDEAVDRLLREPSGNAETSPSRKVCVDCHATRGSGEEMQIEPLDLVPTQQGIGWMAAAVFSHESHRSTSECQDCHRGVEEAEADARLLLPTIEDCRQCHGGAAPARQRVASPCVLCHRFHQSQYGALRPDPE